MEHPELVFLHIPKAAGTSQHKTFNQRYGKASVFWFGTSCPGDISQYPAEQIRGCPIVGGHKELSFYPPTLDPLYCAVVRDPVERAISLFSFSRRPDLAAGPLGWDERNQALQNMRAIGVDPDDMLSSIQHSQEFRASITNNQCAYLSNGSASFDAVLESFTCHDFLVGTLNDYPHFHKRMAELLGWPLQEPSAVNRSIPGYLEKYLKNTELVELLRELNDQDYLLFDYITAQPEGFLESIADGKNRYKRLARLKSYADSGRESLASPSTSEEFWPLAQPNKLPWPLRGAIVDKEGIMMYRPVSSRAGRVVLEAVFSSVPQVLVLGLMPQNRFLRGAKEHHVYKPDQFDQLVRDLDRLCDLQLNVSRYPASEDEAYTGELADLIPKEVPLEEAESGIGKFIDDKILVSLREYYSEDFLLYERD